MKKRTRSQDGMTAAGALAAILALLAVLVVCVALGSVSIPAREVFGAVGRAIGDALRGQRFAATGTYDAIIVHVRLPRVLATALVGAALSLAGAAMQGLLRNPLADGSTLGVSSGAALGAVVALAFGVTLPGLPFAGTTVLAILFAFLSLLIILALAYRFDHALSTNTIILIGVIFGMFCSSIMSLIISFAGEHVKSIVFWTMGSLSGSSYINVLTLFAVLALSSAVIFHRARELNAFAVGEENARHVGVPVRRVKLTIMIASAALIGVAVSIGGSIGFVGLVVPHAVRLITGPNHRRLLPYSLFSGAIFLMLADLVCRTLLNPVELPIGVVTSFIGSIAFVLIFYRARKGGKAL